MALMNNAQIRRRKHSRERGRIYDTEVALAISTVAEALDWICAERLQPVLHSMAKRLVACGELEVSSEVLDKLQVITVSSVERILKTSRPTQWHPCPYPGRRSDTSYRGSMSKRIRWPSNAAFMHG